MRRPGLRRYVFFRPRAARGPAAGEEVADDQGGAVNVGALRVFGDGASAVAEDQVLEDLGCGVPWGADLGRVRVRVARAALRGAVKALSKPEVDEFEAAGAVAGEEDICRLQVAVDDDGI